MISEKYIASALGQQLAEIVGAKAREANEALNVLVEGLLQVAMDEGKDLALRKCPPVFPTFGQTAWAAGLEYEYLYLEHGQKPPELPGGGWTIFTITEMKR